MVPTAQNAIHVLTKLKGCVPLPLLAYWVAPNIILTLAGARGYCDGIFWGEQTELEHWCDEASQSFRALEQIIHIAARPPDIIVSDDGRRYLSYELLYFDGLVYALSQTKLLPNTAKPATADIAVPEEMHKRVQAALLKAGTLPPVKDLHDAADHAAIGILLGYPDKAITGAIPTWDDTNAFAEPTIGADIRGCNYYDCPQPRYDYPRHLASDPDIQAHEQLWSGILRDYYTSSFHKNLEADGSFHSKLVELSMTN